MISNMVQSEKKVVYIGVKDTKYYGAYTAQLLPLTIGKSYEKVQHNRNYRHWVIDDNGHTTSYPKECFITLDEYRSKQIDKIL